MSYLLSWIIPDMKSPRGWFQVPRTCKIKFLTKMYLELIICYSFLQKAPFQIFDWVLNTAFFKSPSSLRRWKQNSKTIKCSHIQCTRMWLPWMYVSKVSCFDLSVPISPVEKPINRVKSRINCNKGLFGIISSQMLCKITY